MRYFCQCVKVKICMCFGQQLVPLCFSGRWSANSFQQAKDTQHVFVPSWLTSHRFALHCDESKTVSCAVWVLWPPVHARSCWSGAKKTHSSKDWKDEQAVMSQKYESISAREEQEVRKATKMRFHCRQTASASRARIIIIIIKKKFWVVWLVAACISCNGTN